MEERAIYRAGGPEREKLIAIRMTKTILFFTERELTGLLSRDPELWRKAIKRGKFYRRARAAERREKSVENSFDRKPRRR